MSENMAQNLTFPIDHLNVVVANVYIKLSLKSKLIYLSNKNVMDIFSVFFFKFKNQTLIKSPYTSLTREAFEQVLKLKVIF